MGKKFNFFVHYSKYEYNGISLHLNDIIGFILIRITNESLMCNVKNYPHCYIILHNLRDTNIKITNIQYFQECHIQYTSYFETYLIIINLDTLSFEIVSHSPFISHHRYLSRKMDLKICNSFIFSEYIPIVSERIEFTRNIFSLNMFHLLLISG